MKISMIKIELKDDDDGEEENQGTSGAINEIESGRDETRVKDKKRVDLPPLPLECQPGARWRWRWRCARRLQASPRQKLDVPLLYQL